ncbi:flavin monoamine oxidase family protein [Nocardia arthritidis]|uniref:NAD(P)-binding protein n=1 Tax=Nocardia arthritidis TaxID=228602 RepID=A0A6G9YHC3_9NOCA|nr:FAD-dependent oxidoreductase [Nocardia arthritidis]QIS12550.1 NAD(P)-binding protein [Nocardia arthritidis]
MAEIVIGRRTLLSTALAAGAIAATTTACQTPMARPDSDRALDRSRALAQEMLRVDDNGNDLTLTSLRTLIDTGLPKTAAPKRVIVVGAGPAGLTAATLLADAGHRVTVLEANGSRTGGRVKTFRGIFTDPALYAEAGAMRLPSSHPLVLALADKLGVRRRQFHNVDVLPDAPTVQATPVVYRSFSGEQWSNGPAADCDLPPGANRTLIMVNGSAVRRADYAANPGRVHSGFGVTLASPSRIALDQAMSRTAVPDDLPIERRIDGWTKVFNTYEDYSTHRYLTEQGWSPRQVEAVGTLENLTSRLHYGVISALVDHALIRPDATFWELAGGTAGLTDALTRNLGPAVLLGKRMTRIEHTEQGVRVWTTAESGNERSDGAPIDPVESFDADYAIVAIPLTSARFCTFDPPLSYAKRRAIVELHHDAATKVLLEFKTRFWEQGPNGFRGGGCVSDSPNRFMYFPSHVEGSDGGVVLAAYTWSDDAMRWDSLTEGERIHYGLAGMREMFGPVVDAEFTGIGISQSWQRARYALGEACIPTPGQLHEHHGATRTVEGRLHFAGDHTSLKPAWIEGALESGVRTALEIHWR